MLNIIWPVDRKGTNSKADSRIIQLLINRKMDFLKPLAKLKVDGLVGSKTIEAIELFQQAISKKGFWFQIEAEAKSLF